MKSNIRQNRFEIFAKRGFLLLLICLSFGSIRTLTSRKTISSRAKGFSGCETFCEEFCHYEKPFIHNHINAEGIDSVDRKTDLFVHYSDSFDYNNVNYLQNFSVLNTFYHYRDIPPWV